MSAKIVKLLGTVQQIVNSLGIDNVSLSFDCQAGLVRLRLEFQDIALKAGRLDGLALSAGLLYIEGLDLSLPKTEMLQKANIRVEHLVLRIAAGMFNRFLDCDKTREAIDNLPVDMRNLSFSMAGERVTLRGEVRKGLVFPFAVDLKPEAKNNKLRVVFENFWAAEMVPMPGFLRRLLMSIVNQKIGGKESLKGVVSIDEDVITINPWPKVPVSLNSEIRRFGVEGHFLVLELGAAAASKKETANKKDAASAASAGSTAEKPQPVKARVSETKITIPQETSCAEESGDMIMPFIS
ncbi:MAG: hypothetical protein Q4F00_11840 [bacterium]|nr:hypothetical protein [bacterium]